MSHRLRITSYAFPEHGDLVERPGPGQAPTAFRIWAKGENPCKDFTVNFTERSAELLMTEQAAQNRPYSFDYNHGSVLPVAGADAGKAAGRHRLEVRNGDLWAVDCEWTPQAKAGIECQPSEWPYFSPTFQTNEANEAISYVNTALTPNPATLNIPALAGLRAANQHLSGVAVMNKAAIEAAMACLASAESSDEDKAKAKASLLALAADGEDKKDDDKEDEKSPEKESDKEDEDDKKEEAAKAAKAAAATVKLAKENQALKTRMDAIDIEKLLAQRPDFSEGVRSWAMSQSLEVVKSFVASTPMKIERPNSVTQGDSGSPSGFVAPAEGTHPIDKVFGIRGSENREIGLTSINSQTGVRTLSHATPAEARLRLAKKGA